MSRRSHWPADVIPHVWRCHCRPERTLSKSVHCLRPVEGRFTPVSATKSRLCTLCYGTQTPVHPQYCVEGAEKKRAYSAPHPCAELWEVLFRVAIVHTLLREPRSDESRQTAEREKVGAETIEQSPGDGALRRAAGGGAARASHPGPNDRPRSPAASGAPVRGCAGAAGGGRGRRLSGSREPASSLQTMLSIHARKPHRHFVHFRSWRCPLPPDSPTGTLSTLVAEAVL